MQAGSSRQPQPTLSSRARSLWNTRVFRRQCCQVLLNFRRSFVAVSMQIFATRHSIYLIFSRPTRCAHIFNRAKLKGFTTARRETIDVDESSVDALKIPKYIEILIHGIHRPNVAKCWQNFANSARIAYKVWMRFVDLEKVLQNKQCLLS